MSAIPGPFEAAGAAADPAAWYLHELTLAQGTAWGNSENTRTSVTMESNGIEAVLGNGELATINSINTGFGYVWPITLVRDIRGVALPSPFSIATRRVQSTCLSRQFSALPLEAGVMFGFCSSADPATAQQLIALGNTWETTTLCKTVAGKKIAGTQTVQRGATGQAGCAGSEATWQSHGLTSSSNNNVNPLDTAFLLTTVQSNQTVHSGTAIVVDAITHIFCCFFYAVALSVKTPTIRADFGIKVSDSIPWA